MAFRQPVRWFYCSSGLRTCMVARLNPVRSSREQHGGGD